MKKMICILLTAVLVFSLAGCNQEPTIVGVWEMEATSSVMGAQSEGTYSIVMRMTFHEDGTGLQEYLFEDPAMEDISDPFRYTLGEGTVTLYLTSTSQGEVPFEHTMELTQDNLILRFYGATYDMKRVSE